MKKPNIFISSYKSSKSDKEWVRNLARKLESEGASDWWDGSKAPPGKELEVAAGEKLRQSDVLAIIATEDSLSTPNVIFELGAAVSMHKEVVLICPEEVEPSRLPLPLRSRQALRQESPQETAKKLIKVTMDDSGHARD